MRHFAARVGVPVDRFVSPRRCGNELPLLSAKAAWTWERSFPNPSDTPPQRTETNGAVQRAVANRTGSRHELPGTGLAGIDNRGNGYVSGAWLPLSAFVKMAVTETMS